MTKLLEQIQTRVSARYAWSALILGTAGLILSGCPGGAELENAEQHLDAGPACDALPILAKCGGGPCHGTLDGPESAGGVNLVQPGVEGRLINVPATYPDLSGCPSPPELLVNSANLDASLMWTKLNNTQQCGDGMPIPHSVSQLNETDMACVYSWMQSLITGDVTPGTGGTTGTGGGDGAGTGGDTGAGGTTGTGGDGAGTGGAGGEAVPTRVEAECALGTGDCTGITGSFTGGPMLEAGDMQVGYITTGVTLSYAGIETAGHDSMTLQYAKANEGGSLEIRLESAAGTLIGTATPAGTGAWDAYMPMTVALSQPLTGTQTIVFVAVGSEEGVLNLDWFELTAGSAQ